MAVYLPVVAALVAGRDAATTVTTVAIALVAVAFILTVALRWGQRLSNLLAPGSDEALLLAVFGLTLLVGGLAQQRPGVRRHRRVPGGPRVVRAVASASGTLIKPLRDLFAATFFLFFSFQIEPSSLGGVMAPAAGLAVVTGAGKPCRGGPPRGGLDVGRRGQLRAGTALIAVGEFSIVIASLAAGTRHAEDLGALAAGYVLITAIVGPLSAKFADRGATRRN